MAHVLEHWVKQLPIVTRCYVAATVLTTIVCSLEIVTPLTLYLNPKLVFGELQLWRLVTNCLYLGNLAFRRRTADFFYMILYGAVIMTGIVAVSSMIPYTSVSFLGIYFLSNLLIFMMVYLWCKYNPSILLNFFGLFNYTAAYQPWGVVAGHAFYFLEELYPHICDVYEMQLHHVENVFFFNQMWNLEVSLTHA